MASEELTVTSEIYSELEGCLLRGVSEENMVSYFKFNYPLNKKEDTNEIEVDEDGDMVVQRRKDDNEKVLKIEHSTATPIRLVGLQVWRGALLLADYVLHHAQALQHSTVLELGSGVGLTSIVTSIVAKHIVCTDVDLEGILNLIASNVKLNSDLVKAPITVKALDFFQTEWDEEMKAIMNEVDLVLAADVIYDNDLTDAFVKTLTKILSTPPKKVVLVALEKRFVFTLEDLDVVAPCYEHFLKVIKQEWMSPPMSNWSMEQLPLDFPQYFHYDRTKHLVIWKLSS
ncbi:methyltransferase-like protein 22 [Macrosteles quadrilineatus]|uniref:methyltransferase-like protein 22 n=1 Tax=Macrosteles quadrilineatus TaxID=74068 RepID=UPI0023E17C26|nr:methyltransferase-like protein 22 [Macrosteles quadrilineatus]XP_054285946.1 methyltransferase-like protein 22 [Macrosteles quadrilineatus]